MERIVVKVHAADPEFIPVYSSVHAAGADLRAWVEEPVVIEGGGYRLIPTGIRIELPPGYEAQVRPRSGLALKHGITVLNAPGTIDSDYRGDVGVILQNCGKENYTVRRGDRIAQMVIAPVSRADFLAEKELGGTLRGSGGFGSTGVQ